MGKLFVRERRKTSKGEKKPRYRIVGISDCNLKIYADHLRKKDIEIIAKEVGADIVYLPVHAKGDKDKEAED